MTTEYDERKNDLIAKINDFLNGETFEVKASKDGFVLMDIFEDIEALSITDKGLSINTFGTRVLHFDKNILDAITKINSFFNESGVKWW